MKQTQSNKTEAALLTVDIGNAFTKVGIFARDGKRLRWEGLQVLPTLPEGFFVDKPIGRDEVTFDLAALLGARRVEAVAATTTRLAPLQLLVAGFANDHISDSLFFCEQLGIEVNGVLSGKKMLWDDAGEASLERIDAVILAGGFERRQEKKLLQLAESLRDMLAETQRAFPIFFVGSAELGDRIRELFDDRHPISLIPNLWPGKSHKDFLKLFVELQEISLLKGQQTDPVLSRLDTTRYEVGSGHAALLSALSLLTDHWKESVLLIDVGSEKSAVCWSYYKDNFSLPVWDGAETLFESQDETSGDTHHYGFKLFPDFGLGGSVQGAIQELTSEELAAIWPVHEVQGLRDRVLNHSLYPAVVPDEMDLRWQSALVRSFLQKVWHSLPPGYQPNHIVFSGAFFGAGGASDSFIDDVLLPSDMPLSGRLWMNRGPSLGVLGTLGKILSDADAIDVEQYLHFYGDYIRLAGRPDRSGLVARVSIDTNQEAVEAFGINRGETHIVGIDVDHKAVVRIHPARRVRVAGNADGEEIILRSSGSQKGLFIDGRCG